MDAAAEGARRPTAGSIASMHAAARLYYGEDRAQHEVAGTAQRIALHCFAAPPASPGAGIVRIEVRPPSPLPKRLPLSASASHRTRSR